MKNRAFILNRDGKIPSDGWYQIEVTGEHPAGKDRRQVIDETALKSIVNRFKEDAKADNFPGLLVDADHLSHDLDNTTAAFAWVKDLDIRNGQLHGKLDLTDLGEPALKSGRFKFFSTEYDAADVEQLGGGKVRPLRLAGLALTNRPNNRGGKPISNRDGTEPGGEQHEQKQNMQPIALKLGLPADADEAAILSKITGIMSELETLKGKDADAEAEKVMNRFGKRIPEKVKPLWKAKLLTNRKDTEELMEASFPENPTRGPEKRIFNRTESQQPEPVTDGDEATAADNKKAAAIRNRATEISTREKIPYNQAFSRAQGELG